MLEIRKTTVDIVKGREKVFKVSEGGHLPVV